MKIRRLVRVSQDFQVSEVEAEIDVPTDSDIMEVIQQLDTDYTVAFRKF